MTITLKKLNTATVKGKKKPKAQFVVVDEEIEDDMDVDDAVNIQLSRPKLNVGRKLPGKPLTSSPLPFTL